MPEVKAVAWRRNVLLVGLFSCCFVDCFTTSSAVSVLSTRTRKKNISITSWHTCPTSIYRNPLLLQLRDRTNTPQKTRQPFDFDLLMRFHGRRHRFKAEISQTRGLSSEKDFQSQLKQKNTRVCSLKPSFYMERILKCLVHSIICAAWRETLQPSSWSHLPKNVSFGPWLWSQLNRPLSWHGKSQSRHHKFKLIWEIPCA